MRMLLIITLILTTSLLIAQSKDKNSNDNTLDLEKLLEKEESVHRLFGIGFGVGNPIANITISFPYIDIDLGYGGFIGLNPKNFISFVIGGIDFIYKDEVFKHTIIGGGVGIGTDWSKQDVTNMQEKNGNLDNTTKYESETTKKDILNSLGRLGAVLRFPFVLEHSFLKNIVIGFKAIATIGATLLISDSISYEGIRFGFFGTGFIKIYM